MAPSSRTFAEFELDCARYELRRLGRPLKLERIPMELLILLTEKEGHVVSRQEIAERLWGKDVYVDTEHGINTAVRKLRATLREDGEQQRFIQTVQGRGYRFVADDRDGDPAPEPAAPAKPRRSWASAAGAAGLLLLVGGLVWLDGAHPNRIRSIAVLPLANLSGDASQEYLADGMTDELITMLARQSSLRVVSRTSAMRYKGARKPLREIARELGVDGILEGSVERSGNRVHMTVQLVHGASDTHLWAESYDRELKDAFALPSELAQTVAHEVGSIVATLPPPRHVDLEAHDAYLRGRYFWFSNDYARSQEYFEKAIKLQPDYASAWSGLADSYVVRAVALMDPPQAVVPQAKRAALRAVELEDSLPEAHNALAALYLFGDWDWSRADAESQRALALNPNYAEARHLHGYVLTALNRGEDALEEQRRSTELDPFARPSALGRALIRARRYEAAVNDLRLRAEAQPHVAPIRFTLSDAFWQQRLWKESAQEMEEGFLALGNKASANAVRGAFAADGGKGVAEWRLARAEARAREAYVSPLQLAFSWARLGRRAETLRFLEEAYREHSAPLVFLQSEPLFDFLHSDERYRALVKKMGFPQAS